MIESTPAASVPETLLQDNELEPFIGSTFRDGISYLIEINVTRMECVADKRAVRMIITPPATGATHD